MSATLAELPDPELIAVAQGGGHQAGAATALMVQRYERLACAAVYRCTRLPSPRREDALQEARIALFKAVEAWDMAKGVRFVTFAHKCVHNAIMRMLGKRQREVVAYSIEDYVDFWNSAHGLDTDGVSGDWFNFVAVEDEDLAAIAFRLDLDHALAELEPSERQVLTMLRSGKLASEIAAEIGISKQRISLRVKRARRHLGAALAARGYDDFSR